VPLCPDFVVELVSSSQNAEALKPKMEEYMENGCKLGWLIDPYNKITQVFRPKMEA
jgi:Uma2 family endonuclease